MHLLPVEHNTFLMQFAEISLDEKSRRQRTLEVCYVHNLTVV